MNYRRRKGATLGLVAVCVMVIIVVGVGVYFLVKILGGGREIANATDAGALHVAKTAMLVSAKAPPVFREFEYPAVGDGITLLTYNRCVAKVMIIAMNAQQIGGSAPGNVGALISALNGVGTELTGKLLTSNQKFDEASTANSHRLVNLNQAVAGKVTDEKYMKPKGATNVFFSKALTSKGLTVPKADSVKTPLNAAGIDQPDNYYMAGYAPIALATGQIVYGTPVFPQVKPHLVAMADYNAGSATYGTAPPNAFKSDSSIAEQKTGMFTGAVACAIIGAVNGGGSNSGSIGNGFEFPAALPYGYIEIQNKPANPKPPGYDAKAFDDNIFNNWLSEDTFVMGDAPSGKTQDSQNLLFSHSDSSVDAWAAWANDAGPMPPNAAPESKTAVYFKKDGVGMPQQLSSATAPGLKSSIAKIKYPRPSSDNTPQPSNCFQQLSDPSYKYGLYGPCVPGAAAITTLTGQDFPKDPPAQAGQNFSNVDQVKAQVLIAFSDKGIDPEKPYACQVSPIANTGLGVYNQFYNGSTPYPIPPSGATMPVPTSYQMPLQQVGTVWQLLNQVGGCSVTSTLDDLVLRCQEIQPKATRKTVTDMLKATQLPMAPAGSVDNYKMYIHLPGGDLSKDLVCTTASPIGFSGQDPDGVSPLTTGFPYTPCQVNKYAIQGTIVNSHADGANLADELVHQSPYLDEDPPEGPGGMVAYDWAHWWPGSGSSNNLGRLWFENGAYGSVHFSHIN